MVDLATIAAVVALSHERIAFLLELARLGSATLLTLLSN